MNEPVVVEDIYGGEGFGGPGPEDLLNAAAALAAALRQFAATEAQAASGLRACLPAAGDPGPISDVRRVGTIARAAAEAAMRAALLLEAAEIVGPGGPAPAVAEALAASARRAGLPAATLVPALRAAALALPTDDASARIAATIRAQELATLVAR